MIEKTIMPMQRRGRPDHFLHDHLDDRRLRLALAEGSPVAMTAAIATAPSDQAADVAQRRTLLSRPGHR
ncbi:hypothetical protein E9232_003374 [Inquilinus ginsengisoli]|uniref:Uncharacterized protein n=1 Tax=Inquilinus ginsengisoli TaxID=363840 RepID=A0ABU1JQF2_9PROT|nr:hypothetical protein [Inquilinus ginsengisoli]MDR6290848.1 hypothetical protein [Inquilinus ginsengisoli]